MPPLLSRNVCAMPSKRIKPTSTVLSIAESIHRHLWALCGKPSLADCWSLFSQRDSTEITQLCVKPFLWLQIEVVCSHSLITLHALGLGLACICACKLGSPLAHSWQWNIAWSRFCVWILMKWSTRVVERPSYFPHISDTALVPPTHLTLNVCRLSNLNSLELIISGATTNENDCILYLFFAELLLGLWNVMMSVIFLPVWCLSSLSLACLAPLRLLQLNLFVHTRQLD